MWPPVSGNSWRVGPGAGFRTRYRFVGQSGYGSPTSVRIGVGRKVIDGPSRAVGVGKWETSRFRRRSEVRDSTSPVCRSRVLGEGLPNSSSGVTVFPIPPWVSLVVKRGLFIGRLGGGESGSTWKLRGSRPFDPKLVGQT